MNRLARAALVLVVGCSPTPKDSEAVGGQMLPAGQPWPAYFASLNDHAVQKELKLTDEQIKKLKDLMIERAKKDIDFALKLKDLPESERMQKTQESLKALGEHMEKIPAGVLTPDQEKRLYELKRRVFGAAAFLLPENQRALSLSDEQQKRIKTIVQKPQPHQVPPFDWQKIRASFQEQLENVIAVLTDEQRKMWKDLIGEPFHFEEPQNHAIADER